MTGDFPGSPVVKLSPSNAGGVSSIPGREAKIPHVLGPKKVRIIKAMVFPVVMYGCESWTIKKAECRRIDVSEL